MDVNLSITVDGNNITSKFEPVLYQSAGMDHFEKGLIVERRSMSFRIERLSDGYQFNIHAGDIYFKE